MDWNKELLNFNGQIEREELKISPIALELSAVALNELDILYGEENPRSGRHLRHHNSRHSFDVMKREFRLADDVFDFIAPKYKKDLPDLMAFGASTHDIYQGPDDSLNVKLSADYGRDMIKSRGYSKINNKKFLARYSEGLQTTQIVREKSGKINQSNIRRGAKDSFKLILASADINGIAMEGPKRMIRDAVNLCYEMYDDEPSNEQLFNFIIFQKKFLKDRLCDGQIVPDIEYYFKENASEVYDLVKKEYGSTIKRSYDAAIFLSSTPIVRELIDKSLAATDKIPGSSFVQNALVKTLNA